MTNLIAEGLIDNKQIVKSKLFTEKQLDILKKRLQDLPLDSNERTYYYKFISPKVEAISSAVGASRYSVAGKEQMIGSRADHALKILEDLERKHKGQKMLVSGSYLFSEEYNDIDVFVFTKYNKKDYTDGMLHVNFMPESALNTLFFSSLSQISVSNFRHVIDKLEVSPDDLLQSYELLVNSILNKEDSKKELRDFIIKCEYLSRGVVLGPKQLYDMRLRLGGDLKLISNTLINALVLSEWKTGYLQRLKQLVSDYSALLKEYRHADNLKQYIDTYNQVISFGS
ncbi:MAG: hypothetical protein WC471_03830 [Candidatus Woesearchaeota archaeon]